MRFVVFDLEANADHPQPDRQEVIEIGAVLVEAGEVVEEFSSLLAPSPGRKLAALTVELTGLTDESLQGAPARRPTLERFAEFCGDLPQIAHNGSTYDFPLLEAEMTRAGVPIPLGERLDTLELAHLVFPRAGREATPDIAGNRPPPSRRLADLADHYQLNHRGEPSHRALADAKRVMGVAKGMLADLNGTGPVRAAQRWLLEATGHPWAMFSQPVEIPGADLVTIIPLPSEPEPAPMHQTVGDFEEGWAEDHPRTDIDRNELVAPLTEGGQLVTGDMEHRPSQEEMAKEVAGALLDSGNLMVEAPTGTGKTLAYLIPAQRLATTQNTQVLVSTYTKALQDQVCLTLDDIGRRLEPVRWTVLKGLSNYLSVEALADELSRFNLSESGQLRDNPLFPDDVSDPVSDHQLGMALAMVVGWCGETPNGEWDDLRDRWLRKHNPAMYRLRFRLSMTETPKGAHNALQRRCFFRRALKRLSEAHIVVSNHSLMLLRDQMTADSPHLIVDEAHEMEAAARSAFTGKVNEPGLWRLLYSVYGGRSSTGLLYRYLQSLPAGPGRDRGQVAAERVVRYWRNCAAQVEDMGGILADYFEGVRGWSSYGGEAFSSRITRVDLNRSSWGRVNTALEALADAFSRFEIALDTLPVPDQLVASRSPQELKRRITQWSGEAKTVSELGFLLANINAQSLLEAAFVCDLTVREGELKWGLSMVPLELHERLQSLWEEKESVVMTSATLTVAGSFDYIADGLGFGDSRKVSLDSPFPSLDQQMLVIVPGYLPAPSGSTLEEFAQASPGEMARLFEASAGRALVLFTANRRMEHAAAYLKDRLFPQIRILCQGEASAPELTENFRSPRQPTCLLGSGTFWQGIDVPGEALSLLVMEKLPFSSPDDPVVAARQELISRRGGRPFEDFLLPQAVLAFRQGAGRLIRSPHDRGVLVVLDKRLGYARYARSFLESLIGGPPVLKPARPSQCYQAITRHLDGEALRWDAGVGRR